MSVDPEMLKTVADALNATMSGVCSEDVTLQSVLEFEELLGTHSGIAATVLRVIYDMLNSTDSEKVHIDGVTKLLSYPEFSDVEKAKDAIALFEDRRDFAQKIMSRSTDKKGLTVHFGEADLPDAGIVLQPIIRTGPAALRIVLSRSSRISAEVRFLSKNSHPLLQGHGCISNA